MNTGTMIRNIREGLARQHGKDEWSIKAFAKKTGIDQNYITHIEKYNKLPSLDKMKKIIAGLGLSPTKAEGLAIMNQYCADLGKGDEIVEYLNETASTLRLRIGKAIILDDLSVIAKHTDAPIRKKLEEHIARIQKEQEGIKKILKQLDEEG
jgi:transcriptional regulator with XRE-family HTH domain